MGCCCQIRITVGMESMEPLVFFRYPDFWKVTHILLKLFVPGIDHWVGNRHEYSIVSMCTYVYDIHNIYIIYIGIICIYNI